MNEIKRFQFVECYPANGDPTYSDIKPDPEGAYVLYSDHLAALAERDEKIAAFSVDAGAVLSSALAERDAEIARLKADCKCSTAGDVQREELARSQACAEARRQERERCAKVADGWDVQSYLIDDFAHPATTELTGQAIAAAIRALGDEP